MTLLSFSGGLPLHNTFLTWGEPDDMVADQKTADTGSLASDGDCPPAGDDNEAWHRLTASSFIDEEDLLLEWERQAREIAHLGDGLFADFIVPCATATCYSHTQAPPLEDLSDSFFADEGHPTTEGDSPPPCSALPSPANVNDGPLPPSSPIAERPAPATGAPRKRRRSDSLIAPPANDSCDRRRTGSSSAATRLLLNSLRIGSPLSTALRHLDKSISSKSNIALYNMVEMAKRLLLLGLTRQPQGAGEAANHNAAVLTICRDVINDMEQAQSDISRALGNIVLAKAAFKASLCCQGLLPTTLHIPAEVVLKEPIDPIVKEQRRTVSAITRALDRAIQQKIMILQKTG